MLGINDAFYASLSADEKAAVDAAGRKAITFNREGSRRAEKESLDAVKAAGVVVTAMDASQREAITKIIQPAVVDWLKTQVSSTAWIDEALAAAKAAQ